MILLIKVLAFISIFSFIYKTHLFKGNVSVFFPLGRIWAATFLFTNFLAFEKCLIKEALSDAFRRIIILNDIQYIKKKNSGASNLQIKGAEIRE